MLWVRWKGIFRRKRATEEIPRNAWDNTCHGDGEEAGVQKAIDSGKLPAEFWPSGNWFETKDQQFAIFSPSHLQSWDRNKPLIQFARSAFNENVHFTFDFNSERAPNDKSYREIVDWLHQLEAPFGQWSCGGCTNAEERESMVQVLPRGGKILIFSVLFHETRMKPELLERFRGPDFDIPDFADRKVYPMKEFFCYAISDEIISPDGEKTKTCRRD